MKFVASCLFCVLVSVCLWAQAPAEAPSQQSPAAQPEQPTHHPMGRDMHQEHMQEMKAQLEKMHATLDQMKANLAKVKDPAAKQQAQLDVDLWEGMVHHLDGMVRMMSDQGMAREGAGMPMGCCGHMKDGAGGCCEGNKCMQGMHREMDKGPAASEKIP